MPTPKVIILGSGNVATHLLEALCGAGVSCGLWSRNAVHAHVLAESVDKDVEVYDSIADIPRDAYFYIISVSDSAVGRVAEQLGDVEGIVAHTSGSVPMSKLECTERYGVFYPLQTFSTETAVDMSKVPFFIEGSNEEVTESLMELVSLIGANPYYADSSHRASLHLAAVFACNFANSLWAVSQRILADAGYPLSVLQPLLNETLRKAMTLGPLTAQTGPAERGDSNVINRQLLELDDAHEQDVYRCMTELIQHQQRLFKEEQKARKHEQN